MQKLNTSFVLGYHGCAKSTAEDLLAGCAFDKSENDYDWLGPGVYFWEANPLRASSFMEDKKRRGQASPHTHASTVGAVIDLGLCLDLTTEEAVEHVASAYQSMIRIMKKAGTAPPVNSPDQDRLVRKLDCAVIRHLHSVRKKMGAPPIDTVRGVFVEGEPIYESAGFYEKTHVQICVCNPLQIKGVFRVPYPIES